MGGSARRRRGEWIAEVTPEAIQHITAAKWRVKAQSRPGDYDVDIDMRTCTCPDHSENGHKCKHQYAVATILTLQNKATYRRRHAVKHILISYLLEEIDIDVYWIPGCRVRVSTPNNMFEVITAGRRTRGSLKEAMVNGVMGLALVQDETKDGYFLVDAEEQKSRCRSCFVRIPNSGEIESSKGVYQCWPCWKSQLTPHERASYTNFPRVEYPRISDDQIVAVLEYALKTEARAGRIHSLHVAGNGREISIREAFACWTRELRRRMTKPKVNSIVCEGDHPLDF